MALGLNQLKSKLPQKIMMLREHLQFSAVLLECLNSEKKTVSTATGFIRREGEKLFLYTCWHVVTGFDHKNIKAGNKLPDRRYLRIHMQKCDHHPGGLTGINGLFSMEVPLYDDDHTPPMPIWHQELIEKENFALNEIRIRVPHKDIVKIELADAPAIYEEWQAVSGNHVTLETGYFGFPGDKVLIVGYPHGFSVTGDSKPTAVALTRFIAASPAFNMNGPILLEDVGAPSMSGSPVFLLHNDKAYIFGIYSGLIYTDRSHSDQGQKLHTALGTVENLIFALDSGSGWYALDKQFHTLPDISSETHEI
jgi:hypothetical protein